MLPLAVPALHGMSALPGALPFTQGVLTLDGVCEPGSAPEDVASMHLAAAEAALALSGGGQATQLPCSAPPASVLACGAEQAEAHQRPPGQGHAT